MTHRDRVIKALNHEETDRPDDSIFKVLSAGILLILVIIYSVFW